MTIYGEFDAQFRKKPAIWRILVIAVSSAAIASVLVSLLVGLAVGILGRGHDPEGVAAFGLFAPPVFLASPLFDAALHTQPSFPWIVGAVALACAVVLLFFWPGNPTLASQILLGTHAAALIAFGAMALCIESILARRVFLREVSQVAGEGAVLLLTIVLAVAGERKIIAVLANLVSMQSPARRIALWLVRLAIPFGILGFLGWAEGSLATAAAAGAFLLVTLVENLTRPPATGLLQLRDVEMREAAATLPIVAILLVAGSIWLSGGVPQRDERVMLWRGGKRISFAPPSEAWREMGLMRPITRESVIRMQWSRPPEP
ncbi:MAG TPA: hypothetical protein VMS56_15835 [Thermoanaerobaculia bacterium]|nr:hypothetical protein [Thermoanaerobaculia bacterium]